MVDLQNFTSAYRGINSVMIYIIYPTELSYWVLQIALYEKLFLKLLTKLNLYPRGYKETASARLELSSIIKFLKVMYKKISKIHLQLRKKIRLIKFRASMLYFAYTDFVWVVELDRRCWWCALGLKIYMYVGLTDCVISAG